MEIIKLNTQNKSEVVKRACTVLKQQGVIVYPTDTVYGLGTDPFNQTAIERLIRIKGRLATKGIPIVILNRKQLDLVARVQPTEERIIEKYWPGPLTIVFNTTKIVPKLLTGGRETVAVRQPKNDFIQALLKTYGQPLASTSANQTGKPVGKNVKEIINQFSGSSDQPDLVIDAGQSFTDTPSTIIRVSKGKIQLIRAGVLKKIDVR